MYTATGNTNYSGIRLENSALAFQSQPNATAVTLNNIANLSGNGIFLNRYDNAVIGGANSGTDPNTVFINLTTPPANQVFGVRVQNSANTTVEQNTISRPNVPTSAYNNLVFGVSVESSTGTTPNNIIGNSIQNLGTGVIFSGSNSNQTIQCNTLNHNWTDVRILIGCNIGNQVQVGSTDQNNIWIPITGSPNCIFGYTSIVPSNWFVPNPSSPPLFNFQMTSSGVTFAQALSANTACPPFAPFPSQTRLLDLVYEQNYGDSLTEEEKYWAKKEVYLLLLSNDTLMMQGTREDTLLQNWVDSTSAANIGLLKTVADSIGINNSFALEINNSISAGNEAEANEITANAIYLATWAEGNYDLSDDQKTALYGIASSNPKYGGTAVFMAYAILDTVGEIVFDEEGTRWTQENFDKTKKEENINYLVLIRPNPAKDETTYTIYLGKSETASVNVFTSFGVTLFSYNLSDSEKQNSISFKNLEAGVYFVVTKTNNDITDVKKLIIVK